LRSLRCVAGALTSTSDALYQRLQHTGDSHHPTIENGTYAGGRAGHGTREVQSSHATATVENIKPSQYASLTDSVNRFLSSKSSISKHFKKHTDLVCKQKASKKTVNQISMLV